MREEGQVGSRQGEGRKSKAGLESPFCLTPWGVLGENQASSCLNVRREAGLPTAVLFVHRLRATQGKADPLVLQSGAQAMSSSSLAEVR